MRASTLPYSLLALGLATLASTTTFSDIPPCALHCFEKAVAQTSCSVFDTYCQCTKGATVITEAVTPCICKESTCTARDMLKVQQVSNQLCIKALAASSQTYITPTIPTNVCQKLGNGGVGETGAATRTVTTAAEASKTSSGNAAATQLGGAGYSGGLLGLAGMAMLVL